MSKRGAIATDHGFVGAAAEVARKRGTGVLTAERGKHRRLFCFERGELIYAISNVIEEQLGATLVRRELLDEDTVRSASRQAAERKLKLGAWLIDQGAIEPDALLEALEQHIRELAVSTSHWRGAEFKFASGRPNLGDEPTALLSTAQMVVEQGRRTSLTADELRILIGPPDVRPTLVAARGSELPESTRANRAVSELLTHCDGSRTLGQIIEAASGSETDVLGTIHALMALGVLEARATDKAPDIEAGGVSRDEMRAVLIRSESADHYGVLGLETDAGPDAIRDAYYYLARRFHPDRFRTGALGDMLGQVETYFTKVTEAYNTLHDADRRAEYDQSRAAPETARDDVQEPGYLARTNFARAKVLIEKRRFQDAVTFLENAIELDPKEAPYHLELGRVLAMNPRRRSEAEQHLQSAQDIDPTLVDSYLVLGDLYRRQGRDEDAIRNYRGVLNWEPMNVEATNALKEMGAPLDDDSGGLLRGLFRS